MTPRDLIETARRLVQPGAAQPTQADLRRATRPPRRAGALARGAALAVTLPNGFSFSSGVSASSFALVVSPNGAFSEPPRQAMG